MPEGDTIFRAARAMHRALAGRKVARFESPLPKLSRVDEDAPIAGRTVEAVTSAGKYLLIRFSGDLVLLTHMRMNGSWHLYRRGERWRRPRGAMRVVIETEAFTAVAFNVPIAELRTSKELERSEELRSLGPDLLAEDFDPEEAARRLRERGDAEVAEALLDQRVMAGIGNVFKSEILFACGVDPFRRVRELTDAQISCLVATARKLLKENVVDPRSAVITYSGYRRTTRCADPRMRLYVYSRGGDPCRRCGTTIRFRRQGPLARVTYWCPKCQPGSGSTP